VRTRLQDSRLYAEISNARALLGPCAADGDHQDDHVDDRASAPRDARLMEPDS
jgi:hypothetical protein